MKPGAVFISVCRSALSAVPEEPLTGPSMPHIVSTISPFLYILYHNVSVTPSSPTSGRQLETVERTPLVTRLHRNEDPTCGGLVQQEEALVDGQRDQQSCKTSLEIIQQPPLIPETFWCFGMQLCCNWTHFFLFWGGSTFTLHVRPELL